MYIHKVALRSLVLRPRLTEITYLPECGGTCEKFLMFRTRRGAKCCRQRLVTTSAVEIAYLVLSGGEPLSLDDLEARPCPALTEEDSCDHYAGRPLACRVFQPWSSWSPIKGCRRHPYSRDSGRELNALMSRLAELNQAFVYRIGLQRSLDFDYLGEWAIADWFVEEQSRSDLSQPWSF